MGTIRDQIERTLGDRPEYRAFREGRSSKAEYLDWLLASECS